MTIKCYGNCLLSFIVQYRRDQNGKLEYLMHCYARSRVHAIAQGARVFIDAGEDVSDIIATENENVVSKIANGDSQLQ